MKVCLVVLDGFGYNMLPGVTKDGVRDASIAHLPALSRKYRSCLLAAHGTHVGLLSPDAMGNSEVGHLTIGAGRVVLQDSYRIRKAFERGTADMSRIASKNSTVHVFGILSDGNIHGSINDMIDMVLLLSSSANRIYIHTVADGRDTRPKAYLTYFDRLAGALPANACIASVSGRFYAMDRDSRDERTSRAYNAISECSNSRKKADVSLPDQVSFETVKENQQKIRDYVLSQYAKDITDEFIEPMCLEDARISPESTIVITNYRVDRVRQMYTKMQGHTIYTMTRVFPEQPTEEVLFERPETTNTLGDIVAENNKTQTRIAETEKKAHVTFFFDGGRDFTTKNQKRIIVPSPKVETYDSTPRMSAEKVTESVIGEMHTQTDLIVVNYANCDMVGHTGSFEATKAAVRCIDEQIGLVFSEAQKNNYALVITADHGNAEAMEDASGPIKAHTINPVPCIIALCTPSTSLAEKKAEWAYEWGFKPGTPTHTLADIAPTVLEIMGIPKPFEMTGVSLLSSTE